MTPARHLVACAVAATLGVAAAAQPPASRPTSTRPASAPTTQPAEVDLDALIARLGDPRWSVRQQATERLGQCPPSMLPRLVAAYRRGTSFEVRLRLKMAAEDIFLRQHLGDGRGFLGIQFTPVLAGIDIAAVLPDTAAERAGLAVGDRILALDGRPVPAAPGAGEWLAAQISAHAPGTKVVLDIARDAKRLKKTVTLGARPDELPADEPRRQIARAAFEQFWDRQVDDER